MVKAGIEITEEPIASLRDYASVPVGFEVASILDVNDDHGCFQLTERPVDARWIKDYDAIPGEHPSEWPKRFGVSRWGVLAARVDGRRVV